MNIQNSREVCSFEYWTTATAFNIISSIFEVGNAFWNKVLRVFIRAVRHGGLTCKRGKQGDSCMASAGFF